MWRGKKGNTSRFTGSAASVPLFKQWQVWSDKSTSDQKKLRLNSQQRISWSPGQLRRALATPCVLSNHQVFTLHPWPPFPLPPPFWMRFSTLSLPVASALCYFPTPCKWHWPAGVNSHSAEEMSQSFGVPNSDGSSITKAANTHYAPITGHHSPNCNSIQSCRKAQSRMSGPKSAEANLRGWGIGKSNIARQHMVFNHRAAPLEHKVFL